MVAGQDSTKMQLPALVSSLRRIRIQNHSAYTLRIWVCVLLWFRSHVLKYGLSGLVKRHVEDLFDGGV